MPSASLARAIARFERKAAAMRPAMRTAYLRGFASLRRMLPESLLERLLTTGGLERMLAGAEWPQAVNRAFAAFRAELRAGVESAGQYFVKDVPTLAPSSPAALAATAGPVVGVAFDVLAPNVVTAVQALETRVITTAILQPVAETIRESARFGLEMGWGPRTTARYIRDMMPLAPNQRAAVENFRTMLEKGDRRALTRALRDRRFDRTLQKALGKGGTGLTRTQINRMVGQYSKRMVAFNAETIARTSALDALKAGQHLTWEQAISSGMVPANEVWKMWQTVGDDRVREEHEALNGETVPFNATYSNGEQIPGETTFNCRCLSAYSVRRTNQARPGQARPGYRPRRDWTKAKRQPKRAR